MKNSTKLLITICFLFIIQDVSAQTIGAKLGLNINGVAGRNANGNTLTNTEILPGFHVGASFDYPFHFGKKANLLIAAEAGFLIESKGFATSSYNSTTILGITTTIDSKSQTGLYYLTFPLIVRVGSDLGVVKLYALTGFSIGVGVYGEFATTTVTESNSALINSGTTVNKRNVNWGEGNSFDFRPLDFGLNFGLGAELNKLPIRFELLFNLGLANIVADQSQLSVLSNRSFAISVGYRFLDFSKKK